MGKDDEVTKKYTVGVRTDIRCWKRYYDSDGAEEQCMEHLSGGNTEGSAGVLTGGIVGEKRRNHG